MAAVAGMVRGPLRQVGSGPRTPAVCPVPSLNLLLSPCQVSGLLKRRFHRSASAALQVTGADVGQGREGALGPGAGLRGRVASRTLAAAESCG